MKFSKIFAINVLWLVSVTTPLAFAQNENLILVQGQSQLPNDVELKASYCMAVVKHQYAWFSSIESSAKSATDPRTKNIYEEVVPISKSAMQKLDDKINRLKSFLLPRVSYLDSTAMLSAYHRGEADIGRQMENSQCIDQCINVRANMRGLCLTECQNKDELTRRISQCADLSFLPY